MPSARGPGSLDLSLAPVADSRAAQQKQQPRRQGSSNLPPYATSQVEQATAASTVSTDSQSSQFVQQPSSPGPVQPRLARPHRPLANVTLDVASPAAEHLNLPLLGIKSKPGNHTGPSSPDTKTIQLNGRGSASPAPSSGWPYSPRSSNSVFKYSRSKTGLQHQPASSSQLELDHSSAQGFAEYRTSFDGIHERQTIGGTVNTSLDADVVPRRSNAGRNVRRADNTCEGLETEASIAAMRPPPRLTQLDKRAVFGNAALLEQFKHIVGHQYDPVGELLKGSGVQPSAPGTLRTISRTSLLLKMPTVSGIDVLELPAATQDNTGHACLVVLPSDKPATRPEALALEALLAELLRSPDQAVRRASSWRAQVLATLCSDALYGLNEALHGTHVGAEQRTSLAWVLKATAKPPVMKAVPSSPGNQGAGQSPLGSDVIDLLQLLQGVSPEPLSDNLMSLARSKTSPGAAKTAVLQPPQQELQSDMLQDQLQKAQKLAVGTAVCMADAIRQVEVQCGERGRVLTYIWNAFVSTYENLMLSLNHSNQELTAANAQLLADNDTYQQQVSSLEYLRREVQRFRKEASTAEQESDQLLKESLLHKQVAEDTKAAHERLDIVIDKQLARLRWQHAFHVLGTRTGQVLLVSGGLKPSTSPDALLSKVLMWEKLSRAVISAKRRKVAFGVRRAAGDYVVGATYSQVVQSALHTRHHQQWAVGVKPDDPQAILMLMSGLQPEAQVLVLSTLEAQAMHSVMMAMDPVHRAELLVLMSESLKDVVRSTMSKAHWRETLTVGMQDPTLAAKVLHVLDMYESVLEFSNWCTAKQMEVLQAMDAARDHRIGAEIIRRLPVNMRKDLLNRMEPQLAARFLQTLEPAAYTTDCLDGVAQLAQVRIMAAMHPARAADVCVQLGTERAADCLLVMEEEETRNAILEAMPPKTAAQVLILINEMASERTARKRRLERELAKECGTDALAAYEAAMAAGTAHGADGAGTTDVDATTALGRELEHDAAVKGEGGEEVAGNALLGMAQDVAGNIFSHMNFKDKAELLTSMGDPGKVASILALMDPADSLALLAAMNDTSMQVVAGALSAEERARLLQALGGVEKLSKAMTKKKTIKKGTKKLQLMQDDRKEELSEAYSLALDKLVLDEDGGADGFTPRASMMGGPDDRLSPTLSPVGGLDTAAARVMVTSSLRRQSMSGAEFSRPSSSRRASHAGNAKPEARVGDAGAKADNRRSTMSSVADFADDMRDSRPRGRLAVSTGNLSQRSLALPSGPLHLLGADSSNSLQSPDAEDGQLPVEEGSALQRQTSSGGGQVAKHDRRRSHASWKGNELDVDVAWGDEEGEEGGMWDSPRKSPSKSTSLQRSTSRKDKAVPRRASRLSLAGNSRAGNATAEKVAINLDADDKKRVSRAMRDQLKGTAQGQATLRAAKSRVDAAANQQDAWEMAMQDSNESGGQNEPNGRLGKLPKNQRLKDAMAQYKHAKPKPKGWLITVVEQVYKDAEVLLKKMGRLEALRKQSVPEVVFAYFHNKYGQKNVVNEYVGSLVNTLTLHKSSDLRLELFAKFLSEEFDFFTFIDFLTAQQVMSQPAKLVCIDYPRDPARDEPYAWACLYKCVYAADLVLGARAKAVRDAFNGFLQAAGSQVDDIEVDKVRRDKRYEGEVIPERFFKLPRPKFMLMLCKELQRINTFISKLAEEKYGRIDVQRTGQVPATCLPGYLSQVTSPGAVLDEAQQVFLQLCGAMAQDIPVADVQVEAVTQLNKDTFILASTNCLPIKEHVRMALLPPPSAEDDNAESELYHTYLLSVVQRHMHTMLPHFRACLLEAGKEGMVQEQVVALSKDRSGDTKFKAYLNLLGTVLNVQVTSVMELVEDLQLEESGAIQTLEQALLRVEDAALLMLTNNGYLLNCTSEVQMARMKRLPPCMRLSLLCGGCKEWRWQRQAQLNEAGYVLQAVWRARKHARVRVRGTVTSNMPPSQQQGSVAVHEEQEDIAALHNETVAVAST